MRLDGRVAIAALVFGGLCAWVACEMDPRPSITCLVGWLDADGTLQAEVRLMTLAEAVEFHAAGWVVLVDPISESGLANWERRQRATRKPPETP
jgi:hypothetical protein